MKNLIFLSGPQGGGKTTLIKLLEGPKFFSPELETKSISLDTEPELRAALKICQRSLENFEYWKIAEKNSDKIILGNRCIYDQFAFNEVYEKKGWIDSSARKKYDELSLAFYPEFLHRPRAIVLNPGFDVVWKHLQKRWKEKEKKWREEDSEYIKLACKAYERFSVMEDIFYFDRKIDLETKGDFDLIKDWAKRND